MTYVNNTQIKERVWNLMDEQDVSIRELSDKLGMSCTDIYRLISSGDVSLKTLDAICDVLNCTLSIDILPCVDKLKDITTKDGKLQMIERKVDNLTEIVKRIESNMIL